MPRGAMSLERTCVRQGKLSTALQQHMHNRNRGTYAVNRTRHADNLCPKARSNSHKPFAIPLPIDQNKHCTSIAKWSAQP